MDEARTDLATWVVKAKFGMVQFFGEGMPVDPVDEFLDAVIESLKSGESLERIAVLVVNSRFVTAKRGSRYKTEDVDQFLQELSARLNQRSHEETATDGAATA